MIPWLGELSVSDRGEKLIRDRDSRWILDLQAGRPGPLHPPGTERRKYAAKTIANLHGLLYSVLQSAVDADPSLRDANPARTPSCPRGTTRRTTRSSWSPRSTVPLVTSVINCRSLPGSYTVRATVPVTPMTQVAAGFARCRRKP